MSSEINNDISKCPFHGEEYHKSIIQEKDKQTKTGGQTVLI